MKSIKKRLNAFTIVELIVVITVIGILATIAIVGYGGWMKSVTESQIKSDLISAATAMENYRSFNGSYPTNDTIPNTFTPSSGVAVARLVTDSSTYIISGRNSDFSISYTVSNTSPTPAKLNDGLVGWWKLNGDASDASGNSNNGTFSTTPPASVVDKLGTANKAYSFNGTSQSIHFGDKAAYDSPELTLSAWIKPASVTGSQNILAKEGQYKYRLSGADLSILASPNGQGWYNSCYDVYPTNFTVNSWYHVVAIISSKDLKISAYVDGVKKGLSCVLSGPITAYNSTNPLYAAAYAPTSEMFNGVLDDLRVYNRALSEIEIKVLFSYGPS
ncbi:MAG: LamG-like jellyroll fold domain-containing protein [Candidatus Saccharibacteria bacterium]